MLGFATRSKSWTPNQPVLRAREAFPLRRDEIGVQARRRIFARPPSNSDGSTPLLSLRIPTLEFFLLQREREGFSFTGFDRDAFEPVELPHRQRCSTVSLMDVDLCHSFTSYGVCACYIQFHLRCIANVHRQNSTPLMPRPNSDGLAQQITRLMDS
jgi:hypothetical protein